jgi:hypothetical protein
MAVPEQVAGTRLPGGTFTISATADHRLRGALQGRPWRRGPAHELWAFIASQRGIGIDLRELFALVDFDIDDGPMLGSVSLEIPGTIKTDVAYRVAGEILSLTRKHGRSGTFDLLTVQERLVAPDGMQVAIATNTFVLPRRETD